MKRNIQKHKIVLLTITLALYLQSGCGNGQEIHDLQNFVPASDITSGTDDHGTLICTDPETEEIPQSEQQFSQKPSAMDYGIVNPSLSRNQFTDAVLAKAGYEDTPPVTQTYAADFDGDKKEEAFVIAGEWGNEWGDATLEMIYGELWFIDSNSTVTRLVTTTTFQSWQQYIKQEGKIYFFIDYKTAFTSWGTLVLTVKENQLILFPCHGDKVILDPADTEHLYLHSYAWGTKFIREDGQITVTQDCYDGMLDILQSESEDGDRFLWFGHTWKPYTFEFDHEQWKEIPAREVTREEVDSIAALPRTFDSSAYDSVQYILRENGELNINMAKTDQESHEFVHFDNLTFLLSKSQEWIAQERDNNGIYCIQLTSDSHWDYLDDLLAELK